MVQGLTVEEAAKRYGIESLRRITKVRDLSEGHPARILPLKIDPGVYQMDPEQEEDSGDTTLVAEAGQVTVAGAADTVIASWGVGSVATGEVSKGYLRFISFDSDTPGKAEYTVIIAGVTLFATQKFQNGVNLDYSDLNEGKGFRLKVGDVVQVLARTDGTSVVHDALIEGQEGS